MDTKALRQKVLDLAIRGKLVPQDPNDEPASVLLERIRQQKQQMVKDGKLKAKDIKNDTIIFVGEDNLHYEKFANGSVKCIENEIPFELPEGWTWCNLSMIGQTNIGLTYKPTDKSTSGIMVLRSSNIVDGQIDLQDLVRVDCQIRENQYVQENDILICVSNGIFQAQDRQPAYPGNEQIPGVPAQRSSAVESCEGAAEELSGECDQ